MSNLITDVFTKFEHRWEARLAERRAAANSQSTVGPFAANRPPLPRWPKHRPHRPAHDRQLGASHR